MRARSLQVVAALGLAAALGGCEPGGYTACYRVECPYPPVYHNSYAGYVPAFVGGRPTFGDAPFDDPFADYTQRSLTISPGAGNAQAANTALQTATPWPRYSSNTNIPGDGAQAARAAGEYESGLREVGTAKRSFQSTSGSGAAGFQSNVSGSGAATAGP